jgi:hypothetical protein
MALSGALLQAIHRYGPSVDHLARSHYGISGQALLAKLIKGESGGRGGAVSKAGARGYAQFMPGTRASVKAKYGVDPWRSPDEAVHAAALHLRGKVTGHAGLTGYNPGGGQQYVDYILNQPVGNVSKGSRRQAGQTGGTVGSTGASQTSSLSLGGTGLAGLLADLTAHPQAQTSLPTPPSFTRGPVMPKGYQQVESSGAPAPKQDLDALLSAVGDLRGPDVPQSAQSAPTAPRRGSTATSDSAHVAMVHGGAYPVARHGKLIGVPYQGTHTLGNWQSDNAVDLRVPEGTPIIARANGTIAKVREGSGGRFAGFQVTLGNNKNAYFYAHLSNVKVKAGQRVRKGQIIGYSGSANGVPHLHFGVEHGNPLDLLGLR